VMTNTGIGKSASLIDSPFVHERKHFVAWQLNKGDFGPGSPHCRGQMAYQLLTIEGA
jgi:hypothetical protein